MPKFELVEAKSYHCGMMARRLRTEHRAMIDTVGLDAHRELYERFAQSSYRKALLIDGRLLAMGGVTGAVASAYGYIWFAMTDEAKLYPLALIKVVRTLLDQIMVVKRELATTIIGGDEAAKRFAVFLGFHVSDDGPGQQATSRAGRRLLARHIEGDPELRVPVGKGYAICLGYHHEGHL